MIKTFLRSVHHQLHESRSHPFIYPSIIHKAKTLCGKQFKNILNFV